MDRRKLLKSFFSALAIIGYVRIDFSKASTMGDMMGGGMMGGGMMGMRTGSPSQQDMESMMSPENRGPMQTGMELFQRHAQVHRKVTFLPNGVHAISVSDHPETAALLQAHVSQMYERLAEDKPFPYPMSKSVPIMFAHPQLYHRKLDLLKDGVAVTETSDDPEMVRVIHEHAREVTRFVKYGMPAMMRSMM